MLKLPGKINNKTSLAKCCLKNKPVKNKINPRNIPIVPVNSIFLSFSIIYWNQAINESTGIVIAGVVLMLELVSRMLYQHPDLLLA